MDPIVKDADVQHLKRDRMTLSSTGVSLDDYLQWVKVQQLIQINETLRDIKQLLEELNKI